VIAKKIQFVTGGSLFIYSTCIKKRIAMTKKVYTFDLLQSIINEFCIQDDRSGRVFDPPVANWRERGDHDKY
jgi:hypothetical protein